MACPPGRIFFFLFPLFKLLCQAITVYDTPAYFDTRPEGVLVRPCSLSTGRLQHSKSNKRHLTTSRVPTWQGFRIGFRSYPPKSHSACLSYRVTQSSPSPPGGRTLAAPLAVGHRPSADRHPSKCLLPQCLQTRHLFLPVALVSLLKNPASAHVQRSVIFVFLITARTQRNRETPRGDEMGGARSKTCQVGNRSHLHHKPTYNRHIVQLLVECVHASFS